MQKKYTTSHILIFIAVSFSSIFFSQKSDAKVHLTLQGSLSDTSMGLIQQNTQDGSASVAFDLGNYIRLGGTYRRKISIEEGYKMDASANLIYSKETSDVVANSVDLTFVLYYGQIFVPYIQLGVVKKAYVMTSILGDEKTVTPGPPDFLKIGPNGGIGLSVRLNADFSLKFSYSISQGYKINHELTQMKFIYDAYTSIGLTYSM